MVRNAFLNTLTMGKAFPRVPLEMRQALLLTYKGGHSQTQSEERREDFALVTVNIVIESRGLSVQCYLSAILN